MDPYPAPPVPDLQWSHVLFSLTFVGVNSLISWSLHLHVGASLVVAAGRCMVQLTIVAAVLQRVFATKNSMSVAGIAVVLNTLGTFETVVVKSRRRCEYMFPAVLFAMLGSTIPVAILGLQFAMQIVPFWTPEQFIPVVGMLCGNGIAGVMVSQSYILKELDENRDKTETLLAYGASRFEACRPLAVEALRLALMPTINQMSVMGIIAIPGMMTGAILGGADVEQAARLQMIIMYMISASSALSCIAATLLTLHVCVDSDSRVRRDRIYSHPPLTVRRASADAVWVAVRVAGPVVDRMRPVWTFVLKQLQLQEEIVAGGMEPRSERTPLLP